MHTEVTLYINDIEIPIAPVDFEYGISSGETTQIATISPSTTAIGSTKGLTYVYRDLGEKYIDLTFNIRTSDQSWRFEYGSNMKTDTDRLDYKYVTGIYNPQEFIDWMIYAHGSGEPLKITIKKYTKYARGKDYTHMLTGTYKVSRTSISSSANSLYHYAIFSLGFVRYMPPVMDKVRLVRLWDDTSDVQVYSSAVESYEPVQTARGFRARYSNDVYSSSPGLYSSSPGLYSSSPGLSSDPDPIPPFVPGILPRPNAKDPLEDIYKIINLHPPLRREIELIPEECDVTEDENTEEGYFKQLAYTTVARALTSVGKDSSRLLRDVFIENPIGLFNRDHPLSPLKVLGGGFWRVFRRGADILLDGTRMGLLTAAGMVSPALQLGVEATLNLTGALISKIPFPNFGSEALDTSAETPLLGDGGIVLSSDTDLGFDPKLHATGFDPDTISPVYRILEPGIYKKG